MAHEQIGSEELVVGLYDRKALAFSNFGWTLKSGRKSPIYYNQRKLTSFDPRSELSNDAQVHLRDLAVEAYSDALDSMDKDYNHLYGIPQGVTAITSMVAHQRGESLLWGRVGDKDYGVHTPIEGDFAEGDTVVSLDDVITTAASKFEAASNLEAAKLRPDGFVVMFDREEGGVKAVHDAGHTLVAINGLALSMGILSDAGRIGAQEFEWVDQYHEGLRADGLM